MRFLSLYSTILLAANAAAYDSLLHFGSSTQVETRSINQIYKAALKEGGVNAFESAFPGMKLNLTTDLSKYLDGNIDQQLANNNVYVDTLALQTTQDFPRWKEGGALLYYAPAGFDKIYSGLKDTDAAFYRYTEYKGKLALIYPNDDDLILFLFDKILNQYGESWFNKLFQQKPCWVRGAATPQTLVRDPKTPYIATFTSALGLTTGAGSLNATYPKTSNFISWAQHTAILKNAPHPKGAKLLQNVLLSKDFQKTSRFWPVRSDVAPPAGFPEFIDQSHTDPYDFMRFMVDRERVKRLRFWFEKRLGTAQGLSPLDDDL
ncbi:ABC transporter [Fusarium circinatum]|uniref:ABC transporter n=1 Tax=Fusarium circinatum TaxID=48490 RepID=A0A8H5XDM9_FUSCI|nr:ABC transporter [Fusarium circinatum]